MRVAQGCPAGGCPCTRPARSHGQKRLTGDAKGVPVPNVSNVSNVCPHCPIRVIPECAAAESRFDTARLDPCAGTDRTNLSWHHSPGGLACDLRPAQTGVVKRLLVAVDFSPVTGDIVRVAARLAFALRAEVRLLHVAPPEPDFVGYAPGPDTVRQRIAADYQTARRQLHAIETSLRSDGLRVDALAIQGDPVEKILAEAAGFDADIILLGSHGHGALHHLLAGSVAAGVLKSATIPVLVVPSARPA